MSDNTVIWNQVCTPPSWALRKIDGGRLRGKYDINPQWRYEVLTKVFGACGQGWKYTIDKLWTESVNDGIVLAFAQVTLYIKAEQWSEGIPGIGGHQMVEKEMAGLHANDECYKMAVTDALSVACKMIGIGADVYKGVSDSKYNKNNLQQPQGKTSNQPHPVVTKFYEMFKNKDEWQDFKDVVMEKYKDVDKKITGILIAKEAEIEEQLKNNKESFLSNLPF